MPRLVSTFALVASCFAMTTLGDDAAKWRTLPLIQDGKVAPEWVHLGWGSFGVQQDSPEQMSLRTDCDAKGMGLLLYKAEKFGNCQIRVVYRGKDPKSNAGVFVRIDPGILDQIDVKPAPIQRTASGDLAEGALEKLQEESEKEVGPWYAVHHGFEVQICDNADADHRTGAIYSLATAKDFPKSTKGEWNTMLITLDGTRITVEINGQPVTSFDSETSAVRKSRIWYEPKREPKRPIVGYIGLQNHDPGDVVYFKEISVRELPAK